MKTAEQRATANPSSTAFNYAKLQATACMLASAAVSIGLTWFAITRLS